MSAVAVPAGVIFKADHLTVAYPGARGEQVTPLSDLSLAIRAGEITCILGPSGCGKTTLLKALGGFIVGANTGGVIYEGRFLGAPTPDIVMIFQENNLFPWLNVRRNVAFGLRYRDWDAGTRQRRLDDILRTVGLAEAARRYPHQLSGGMRQRVAIARAIVIDPRVLLLDEPFSALDVNLRRRMQDLLREIWAATGKTMVMVTHNVEEAIQVGHRVIVLGGRPSRILLDADVTAPDLSDRYAPSFLALQRRIEEMIY